MSFRNRFRVFTRDERMIIHLKGHNLGSRVPSAFFVLSIRSGLPPVYTPCTPTQQHHSTNAPSYSKNMLLYEDILTGDEMVSDAFHMYISPFSIYHTLSPC